MSDLRKAIEELADELLDRRDAVGRGELRRTAESAYEEVARHLRAALAANPAPEVEWEWGAGGALITVEDSEQQARTDAGLFGLGLWKRTAPGPWVLVEGDNEPQKPPAADYEGCHAGRDGDCTWSECPQEANGRANYQPFCPRWNGADDE